MFQLKKTLTKHLLFHNARLLLSDGISLQMWCSCWSFLFGFLTLNSYSVSEIQKQNMTRDQNNSSPLGWQVQKCIKNCNQKTCQLITPSTLWKWTGNSLHGSLLFPLTAICLSPCYVVLTNYLSCTGGHPRKQVDSRITRLG